MKEYEEKIHDHQNDYYKKREDFVKRMMQSTKSKVVLPKNHHNRSIAEDLDKLNSAMNFVTEMQIQNSLQDIYNQEERNDLTSDNTHATHSQVSNQQQIVIKTKNKTERTNIEFPSKNVSIMNSIMN